MNDTNIVKPEELLRRVNFLLRDGTFMSGLIGHNSTIRKKRRPGLAFLLNHPSQLFGEENNNGRIPLFDVFQLIPQTSQITKLPDFYLKPERIILGYDVENIKDVKTREQKKEIDDYTSIREQSEFTLVLENGLLMTGKAYVDPNTQRLKELGKFESDYEGQDTKEKRDIERFRIFTDTNITFPHLMKLNHKIGFDTIQLSSRHAFDYRNSGLLKFDSRLGRDALEYVLDDPHANLPIDDRERAQYIVKTLFDQAQPIKGQTRAIVINDDVIYGDSHIVRR